MPLLDLPPELLALIAHHVGVSELRKSIAYLLVAKRCYHAILPVYLFWLPLSDLYLVSHRDLEILPSPDTVLSSLIQTKAKRLPVRLVGHHSKYPSVAPWHDNMRIEPGQDGMKKVEDWNCDIGPVKAFEGPIRRNSWRWPGERQTLHRWADRVNEKLFEMAAMLPMINNLDEFSPEAASEFDSKQGPRWD